MNEERKMILNMLKDGKITAVEAERLLKALHLNSDQKQPDDQTTDDEKALSPYVDWEGWEDRRQSYKQKASSQTISAYIESFIQKVKDVDLDFNFGRSETVNHIFQDQSDDVNKVTIEIGNGSVSLQFTEEDTLQVDCTAKVYQVKSSEEARLRFLRETQFDMVDDELVFTCERRDLKVNTIVYVPKKKYKELNIQLFNGSVTVDPSEIKDVHVKTVNGNINVSNLLAKHVELETGNGTISVTGQADHMELESLNGALSVTGACRDLTLESFSGRLTTRLSQAEIIRLKSVTGSIDAMIPNNVHVNGELQSNFGSIHCELHSFEVLKEKTDLTQRLLKFVANKGASSSLILEASTKTGTITVTDH